MDLDLDGLRIIGPGEARRVPVVAVRQNVYPIKGKGFVVHDGKSALALRVVPLPEFVVTRLRGRQDPLFDPSWPLFASAGRDGTPTYRWPANNRTSPWPSIGVARPPATTTCHHPPRRHRPQRLHHLARLLGDTPQRD